MFAGNEMEIDVVSWFSIVSSEDLAMTSKHIFRRDTLKCDISKKIIGKLTIFTATCLTFRSVNKFKHYTHYKQTFFFQM